MVESRNLRINHKDGTSTFLGTTSRSFAVFFLSSNLISEEELQQQISQLDLPLHMKPDRVRGWGGFSVAFRLKSTADSPNYVGVLRDFPQRGLEQLSTLWRQEKQVNRQFAPYTLPQDIITTSGIAGKPMVLKLSPEVTGDTFKNLSALYILGNREVLRQYIDLARKAMGTFMSEGKLIDTSGHIAQNPIRQVLLGFNPFCSDNFMVEFGTNKLVMVDCDIKPSIHLWKEARISQKIGLLVRAAAISASALLALSVLAAHKLRDSLLKEKPLKEPTPQFTQGLKKTIAVLDELGCDYRVLGSVAIAAALQEQGVPYYLSHRRRNHSRRDMDILLLNPEYVDLEKLDDLLSRLQNESEEYPVTSVVVVKETGDDDENIFFGNEFLPAYVSRVRKDQVGNLCLTYGDICFNIPPHLMRPVIRNYQGVEFPTLEINSLVGFALTRGGVIKFKDIEKLSLLTADYTIPDVFIDFAREMRANYPELYRNFLIREWVSYFTGGFIGGGQLTELMKRLSRTKSTATAIFDSKLERKKAA